MIRVVVLRRGAIGYGFSINSRAPTVIEAIVKDSAADYAALQVNDVMIEINGVEVVGLRYDDVIQLISNSGGDMKLTVECKKKNPHLLPTGTFWSPRRISIARELKKNKQFCQAKDRFAGSPKSKSDSSISNCVKNSLLAELQKDSLFAKMKTRLNSQGSTDDDVDDDNMKEEEDEISSLPPPLESLSRTQEGNEIRDGSFSIVYTANKTQSLSFVDLEESAEKLGNSVLIYFVGSKNFTENENFYCKSLSKLRSCMQDLKTDKENRLLLTHLQIKDNKISIKSSTCEIDQSYRIDQLAAIGACLNNKLFFGLVFCDKKNGASSVFSLYVCKTLGIKCNEDQAVEQFGLQKSMVELPSSPQLLLKKLCNLHMKHADAIPENENVVLSIDRSDSDKKAALTKIRNFRSDTSIRNNLPIVNDEKVGSKRPSPSEFINASGESPLSKKCKANTEVLTSDQVTSATNLTPSHGRAAKWKDGIEFLLADPAGLRIFHDFLEEEHSEENILFLLACQKFNKISNTSEIDIIKYATAIYNTFLVDTAIMAINIDYIVLKSIKKYLKSPNLEMFNMAQKHIIQLLKFDSYPRFLKSKLYEELVVKENEGKLVLSNDNDVLVDHVFITSKGKVSNDEISGNKKQKASNTLSKLNYSFKHRLFGKKNLYSDGDKENNIERMSPEPAQLKYI